MAEACMDACGWLSPTAWQLSLNALSAWAYVVSALSRVDIALVPVPILLVAYYLPLLAAAMVVAWSVGFLVWPHHALARWG
jgi:hypothetical protein